MAETLITPLNQSKTLKSSVLFVINPRAGRGRAMRLWENKLRGLANQFVGDKWIVKEGVTDNLHDMYSLVQTTAGSCTLAAVVAVGGDGTVQEVANCLMNLGEPDVALGVLPLGTGSDFSRSIGWNELDYEEIMQRIKNMETKKIDIGEVSATPFSVDNAGSFQPGKQISSSASLTEIPDLNQGPERGIGQPQHCRYFINVASVGFSAAAAQNVNNWKFLGPFLSYTVAALLSFRKWKSPSFRLKTLKIEDKPDLTLVAACNGQYFGGGMKVAPKSQISDGELDVITFTKFSITGFILKSPLLRSGKHLELNNIDMKREKRVEVYPLDKTPEIVLVEADGEVIGTWPVTFEIIPRALPLII